MHIFGSKLIENAVFKLHCIIEEVSVSAETCLHRRCIVMNVLSGSAVLPVWHITNCQLNIS
jgi:hypothetical protein